jgi:ubiquinone/menaquinone biosynthesis C-methylase UbiE
MIFLQDLQNHIWSLTLQGKLHLAPLPEFPQRVLDIGCGTGIWAIDFGKPARISSRPNHRWTALYY